MQLEWKKKKVRQWFIVCEENSHNSMNINIDYVFGWWYLQSRNIDNIYLQLIDTCSLYTATLIYHWSQWWSGEWKIEEGQRADQPKQCSKCEEISRKKTRNGDNYFNSESVHKKKPKYLKKFFFFFPPGKLQIHVFLYQDNVEKEEKKKEKVKYCWNNNNNTERIQQDLSLKWKYLTRMTYVHLT